MGKKISQLPLGTAVSGPELFPAVQSGTTKKFTLATLMSWIVGIVTPTSIGAQPKITASGILKGDGQGSVTAATAGTDYGTYSKPSGGIPASDLASGVIPSTSKLRWYGRCDSAADASEREVSISGITELSAGLVIAVLMITAQDYNGSPTLNLNNLGAKPIRRRYASSQEIGKYEWQAGAVLEFYYTSSYWVLLNGGHSTSNYYGLSRGSSDSPLMDGIASTGTSNDYARGDHVHPSDTTKTNQAQLATVESGSTASRAYAVGEYFCLNGLLYRVTAAISSGGTFTAGTNCEFTTVGTELQSLGTELQSRLIIKTFDLAAGKSLTIQPRNTSAQVTCILASNGVRTATAMLYYMSLATASSNYHIIKPIVTATSVSVSDSGGITTITNNHASDVVRISLLTLYTAGTVYYNIV